MLVAIVDYGTGNTSALVNACARLGVRAHVTNDVDHLDHASAIVLPGVGRFSTASKFLNETPRLKDVLNKKVLIEKVPVLGICLGMQLLLDRSDEASGDGLLWIRGLSRRLPTNTGVSVPHMGWNSVSNCRQDSLLVTTKPNPAFYFAHSFYADLQEDVDQSMAVIHGIQFPAAIQRGNIYGVQFHPEKSHAPGLEILRSFLDLACP